MVPALSRWPWLSQGTKAVWAAGQSKPGHCRTMYRRCRWYRCISMGGCQQRWDSFTTLLLSLISCCHWRSCCQMKSLQWYTHCYPAIQSKYYQGSSGMGHTRTTHQCHHCSPLLLPSAPLSEGSREGTWAMKCQTPNATQQQFQAAGHDPMHKRRRAAPPNIHATVYYPRNTAPNQRTSIPLSFLSFFYLFPPFITPPSCAAMRS